MRKQLVLAATLLVAFAMRSPAPSGGGGNISPTSVDVNVDGNEYVVTTDTDTYGDASSLLATQPWYGNASLASDVASAVGVSLTQQTGSALDSSYGPLFVYAAYNGLVQSDVYQGAGVSGFIPSVGSTYSFAVIEAVPESPLNPVLLGVAGLFVVVRGWRAVRPVQA